MQCWLAQSSSQSRTGNSACKADSLRAPSCLQRHGSPISARAPHVWQDRISYIFHRTPPPAPSAMFAQIRELLIAIWMNEETYPASKWMREKDHLVKGQHVQKVIIKMKTGETWLGWKLPRRLGFLHPKANSAWRGWWGHKRHRSVLRTVEWKMRINRYSEKKKPNPQCFGMNV